ncbi:MAG TPA: hypothetical protein VIN61_04270 [Gammaproteobacteria bacterium]
MLSNRREFLQTAAALSAASLAGGGALAAQRERAAWQAVVYDARHAYARDFGARAGFWGAPLRAIEGDVTDLWQHELLRVWKTTPGAIAGLTERPALFLLERLGWEHGLRVVFEAEHRLSPHGEVEHDIVRPADAALARELRAAGARWPGALADLLVAGGLPAARELGPSGAALAAHLREPPTLCSWIIAPRSAVQREI